MFFSLQLAILCWVQAFFCELNRPFFKKSMFFKELLSWVNLSSCKLHDISQKLAVNQ